MGVEDAVAEVVGDDAAIVALDRLGGVGVVANDASTDRRRVRRLGGELAGIDWVPS